MSKKILIIDDSALMRRVISDIIKSGNDYEVADIARDGLEGFDMIVSNPNLYSAIILDINMPKMNGLELLEKLQKMHIHQTIIVVSTVAKQGAKETIKALELGAFDFVTKPENYLETKGEVFKNQIHEMLDVATSDSVRKRQLGSLASRSTAMKDTSSRDVSTGIAKDGMRRPILNRESSQERPVARAIDSKLYGGVKRGSKKIIALACSTGGPKSLQQVIPLLPKDIDAPMVLVQHMPAGFTASLAQRLDELSEVHVKEAQDGDVLTNGVVYIAPGGSHMRVAKSGSDHVIKISYEPAIDGLRPCANVTYDSLNTCGYDDITCVVLTGMGADGTKGIKGLSQGHAAIHVIAQDEDTCVVYGMPKAIAQSGLVDTVVPLTQVAEAITKNVGVS